MIKLTPVQYKVYSSLNYDWQTPKELEGDKDILNKLVKFGYAEKKLSLYGWSYRKANKRIMVG
jgi:hypothetical protein